jgi:hypothetical protein
MVDLATLAIPIKKLEEHDIEISIEDNEYAEKHSHTRNQKRHADGSWTPSSSEVETEIETERATSEAGNTSDHRASTRDVNVLTISKLQFENLTDHLKAAITKADRFGQDSTSSKKTLQDLENATTSGGSRFFGEESEEAVTEQVGLENATGEVCKPSHTQFNTRTRLLMESRLLRYQGQEAPQFDPN